MDNEKQIEIGTAFVSCIVFALFVGVFCYHFGNTEGKISSMSANNWKHVEGNIYVKEGRVVKLIGNTAFVTRYKLEEVK